MPCWLELQGLCGGSKRASGVEKLQDLTLRVIVKAWA